MLSHSHMLLFFIAGKLHFAYVSADDVTSSSERYACYMENNIVDMRYPGSYTQLTVNQGLPH